MERNYSLIPELLFNHYALLPPYLIASLSPSPPVGSASYRFLAFGSCLSFLPASLQAPSSLSWTTPGTPSDLLPPVLFFSKMLSPLHIWPLIPSLKIIHPFLWGSSGAGPCLPKSYALFLCWPFVRLFLLPRKLLFLPQLSSLWSIPVCSSSIHISVISSRKLPLTSLQVAIPAC